MSELRVEREGSLAIVTLARATKLNALTFAMLDGLAAAAAIETLAGALAAGTADAREGVAAFKEKRKAEFEGR